MINQTAVATFRHLPIPLKNEVFVLFISRDVAVCFAAIIIFYIECNHPLLPKPGKFGPIIIAPSIHGLTIEKEFPTVSFFFVRSMLNLILCMYICGSE